MAKIVFVNSMTGFFITRRHVVDVTSSVSVRRYPDVIPGNYTLENTCKARIRLKEGTGGASAKNMIGRLEIVKFSDLPSQITVLFTSKMDCYVDVRPSKWWWNPIKYPWVATFFGLLNHKLPPDGGYVQVK